MNLTNNATVEQYLHSFHILQWIGNARHSFIQNKSKMKVVPNSYFSLLALRTNLQIWRILKASAVWIPKSKDLKMVWRIDLLKICPSCFFQQKRVLLFLVWYFLLQLKRDKRE